MMTKSKKERTATRTVIDAAKVNAADNTDNAAADNTDNLLDIEDNTSTNNTSTNNTDNTDNTSTDNAATGEQELTLEQLKAKLAEVESLYKSAKADAKAADKKPRYTRGHALIEALQKGGTRQQIVEMIDNFYSEHGGQANRNGALTMISIHIPVFKLAGLVQEDKDKDQLIWSGPEINFAQEQFRD